ncbi:MAG: hypothetical protein K6C68_10045 [Ruminococcus sp.]|nr:hypothetical protein [Ruminococcus sp.]
MNENFPYKDIIDLPHHQAEGRKHMSLYDRAAQFSAFAALSGYDDMITETGRITEDQIELPEHIQDELNNKFVLLNAIIEAGYRPEIKVTYFVPDKTKEGGSYESYIGDVKRVDSTFRQLMFYDKEKDLTGKVIDIGMITSVESNLFAEMM